MRKVGMVLAVVTIVGITTSSWANAEEPSVTLSTKVWSKYLWNNGAIFHNKPVLQTDLIVSLPKGFYFEIWHSVGLDGTGPSSDLGDEIDYAFGWSGKIKKYYLGVGVAYFDFVELFKIPRDDVIQPYIDLSAPVRVSDAHILISHCRAELLFPAQSISPEEGFYLYGGLGHAWQVNSALAVNHKFDFLIDWVGALGFENAVLLLYNLGLNWDVSKSVTVEPVSVKVAIPITHITHSGPDFDRRKPDVVFGAGLTFSL